MEKDITGMRFGRLTAISRYGYSDNWIIRWTCRCDCGNIVRVYRSNLVSGKTKSCGCLRRERMKAYRNDQTAMGPSGQTGEE